MITNPIEMWVYFLRWASELTPQQLGDRAGDEVFAEAAGVLEMIARSPRERELYEARLKMQRDEQSRIAAAKDQGLEEGLEKRRLIGRVQLLESLLGLSESSATELKSQTLAALSKTASASQRRLRERG